MEEFLFKFFDTVGGARVYSDLYNALNEYMNKNKPVVREFYFNAYDVKLDFETKQVYIFDVIDTSKKGTMILNMSDFFKIIKSKRQKNLKQVLEYERFKAGKKKCEECSSKIIPLPEDPNI